MKKMKKWLAVLATLCLGACVGAFVACDDESTPDTTPDTPNNEQGGGEVSEKETLTITVKDTDGNPMVGVKIKVNQGSTTVAEVTTTENGTALVELEVGVYMLKLDYDSLPTLFIPDSSEKSVTVADETAAAEFVLEDLNPDGSMEKPFACFPGELGQFDVVMPANTTYYYYAVKVVGKKIVVRNDGVTINFKQNEYTANNGEIQVLIGEDVDSQNTPVLFAMTNTTGAELAFSIYFEDLVKVEQRDLTFDETITVSLPNSSTTIDYNWTATSDGVVVITCASDRKNIAVRVKNDSADITTTMDTAIITVTVKAGDQVKIVVSATRPAEGDAPAEIPFTATFNPAQE